MKIDQNTNEVTMTTEELSELLKVNYSQSEVILIIVNALQKHSSLFPDLQNTEKNQYFFSQLSSILEYIPSIKYPELMNLNSQLEK